MAKANPEPEVISAARVSDGKGGKKLVNPGNKVNLSRDSTGTINQLLHQLSGEGPYTISWIGQWPCGGVTLYLETTASGNIGIPVSDFIAVD